MYTFETPEPSVTGEVMRVKLSEGCALEYAATPDFDNDRNGGKYFVDSLLRGDELYRV